MTTSNYLLKSPYRFSYDEQLKYRLQLGFRILLGNTDLFANTFVRLVQPTFRVLRKELMSCKALL